MKKFIVVGLHISYWLMYTFLVVFVFLSMRVEFRSFQHLLKVLFMTPVGVASYLPAFTGFYSFYFLLFDKFLHKKKLLKFFVLAVTICISVAVIAELLMNVLFVPPHYHINWNPEVCISSGLMIAFIACVNGILALTMKGFFTWYEEIRLKNELQQKNYEMELALLKSQINPHFLFNTINNIDVLILKEPEKASEYLNKLSEIMRFMLYETRAQKIPLTTELSYIQKYIELQKLRTANPNYITLEINGDPAGIMIEPMLFIPFIENAFKHTENKKTENAIKISFSINKNRVSFVCENSFPQATQVRPEYGGLGTELIQRRLSLLYPANHSLETVIENNIYRVKLLISIQDDRLHYY
jgi:two-component system, LytTR family, sensor kinase